MNTIDIRPTDMARFLGKVEKTETCWLWKHSLTEIGYGQFTFRNRKMGAHRAAYILLVGPIPDGMDVDHLCHVRHCMNPEHLRVTTRKQNAENRQGAKVGSASGVRGVVWDKQKNAWRAMVTHHGKSVHGGFFTGVPEAAEAARLLRLELFTHSGMDRSKP